MARCSWLVERRRVVTEEMAEAGWYPDFPSDLVEVVECGDAVEAGDERGLCVDHARLVDMDELEFERLTDGC